MENFGFKFGQSPVKALPIVANAGCGGVCMMSNRWKDEQHPSFIHFISSFLNANSFRLNIVPVASDFIFNCGGLSVAFVFVTNWDCNNVSPIFSRVQKLKGQFGHLYIVVTLPTKEQNDSFVHSYFKYGMELGRPTFVPVKDLEMGFEKIVKIAHGRGVCKQQDVISKMKVERERSVQGMDAFIRVLMSIPGIENHDANALYQIGSIQAISKASKDYILENTDLSADKAEMITRRREQGNFWVTAFGAGEGRRPVAVEHRPKTRGEVRDSTLPPQDAVTSMPFLLSSSPTLWRLHLIGRSSWVLSIGDGCTYSKAMLCSC
ncbi:hypothetical protein NE237_026559 [Protea cynaroides]|uniref:Uncharacterized protein n=1 Tax=Protea cynaroides TaxID=273540 RepID=A0A9Q0K2U8_9MAGN|nr:hypothetical protein NE237_026559 [Protea cynaroides]